MMAAEYASPMPGSAFSSSCEAELMSISLLEAGAVVAVLLGAGFLDFEPLLDAWYGAAASANPASRRIQIERRARLRCVRMEDIIRQPPGFSPHAAHLIWDRRSARHTNRRSGRLSRIRYPAVRKYIQLLLENSAGGVARPSNRDER